MHSMRLILAVFVCAHAFVTSASAQDADSQMPNFYSEPGLNPNRDYTHQHFAEHIDPFTGKLQLHFTDIFIPGPGGFDLRLQRSYTSVEENTIDPSSPLGLGWTMHFGRVISIGTDCRELLQATIQKAPVLELPDGSHQQFAVWNGDSTGQTLISANRWRAKCNGAQGYVVTSPDGMVYEMTQPHTISVGKNIVSRSATKITDKNGNSMAITYDTTNSFGPVVSTVEASDGSNIKRILTFSYTTVNGTHRLQSVTANTNPAQTYTYQYTEDLSGGSVNFFLTRVTRSVGDFWTYDYFYNPGVGRYAMKNLTYPEGGKIAYQYAFVMQLNSQFRTTVINTKTTDDFGTWTFLHTPGSFNVPDKTTVTTPNGQIQYEHVGFNTITSESVWKIGLLTKKTTSDGSTQQTEIFEWDKQAISAQDNARAQLYLLGAPVDNDFNAPVLVKKTITRDGTNYTTSYPIASFDIHGNPGQINETGNGTPARSVTRTYCVDPTNRLPHNIATETLFSDGARGGDITRTYFGTCLNLQSENRFGVTTQYTYFPTGDVQTKTNPRGFVTSYSSYKRGIPQSETLPVSNIESILLSRVVSDAGNVASETNGEGFRTTYGYDAVNRLTSIGRPIGNPVSISWSPTTRTLTRGAFNQIQIVDGYGRVTLISAGPATIFDHPNNIVRRFTYNAVGQKTFESAPGFGAASAAGVRYAYDVLDRPTSISHLDTGGSSVATRALTYLTATNAVSVRDERLNTTRYDYLSFGNPDERYLTGITPPAGTNAATTIGRNVLGQITTVSQGTAGVGAGVVTRTYGYDSNNGFYLTSIQNPETGTTTMERDAAGNMSSRQVANSGITLFAYDGQNRLKDITYPTGPSAQNVAQVWNKNNKLTSSSNVISVRGWGYDANDNLKREDLSIEGNIFSITYDYDLNDQLSGVNYLNAGSAVTYLPDVFGWPNEARPFVTGVGHHATGQISSITHANGVTTSIGQDTRLRPFTIQTGAAGSIVNLTYGYDAVNNVTSITDSANSNNNRTLSYDGIDRLNLVNGSSITYDGAGNILTQNFGGTLNYSYDPQKRLGSTSGIKAYTFSYDLYGNVAGYGTKTFQYDDASNLRGVAGDVQVQYEYDGRGMRVKTVKNGTTAYSMYGANGELMFEFDPLNSLGKEHIHLQGQRIATRTFLASSTPSSSPPPSSQRMRTTVSVSASPGSVGANQPVTLTATVNSGFNPTRTMSFFDNGAFIGTAAVTNGTASFLTPPLNSGVNRFTVTYGGDGSNEPSSSFGAVGVDVVVSGSGGVLPPFAVPPSVPGNRTSVSLAASASQTQAGQPVTLTATVTGGNPVGVVSFFDNGYFIGSAAMTNGAATLVTQPLNAGSNSFTATYSGDGDDLPSSSFVPVVLGCPGPPVFGCSTASPPALSSQGSATFVSLSTSSFQVAPGNPVTLTAVVSGLNPIGSVTFFDGGVSIGTANLANGVATISTGALNLGMHNFTASYGGDGNNLGSTSAPIAVTAGTFATSVSLTASASQVDPGQSVTLTATVSGHNPVGGSVTFNKNGTAIGTVTLASGSASLASGPLAFGVHSFTASYSGDASGNVPSSSAPPTLVTAGNVAAIINIINSILLDD